MQIPTKRNKIQVDVMDQLLEDPNVPMVQVQFVWGSHFAQKTVRARLTLTFTVQSITVKV
jgi:hypothetical protein